MPNYETLFACVRRGSGAAALAKCSLYDARVVVTIPLGWKEQSLCPLKNHPKFVFIIHHAEHAVVASSKCNGVFREIVCWSNSFVAGELASLRELYPPPCLPKTFTPSFLPIAAHTHTRPSSSSTSTSPLTRVPLFSRQLAPCHGSVPRAILFGDLSVRRDLAEIDWVLRTGGRELHVTVLTRHEERREWTSRASWAGQWIRAANMTAFHEAFQGAAFLLAGMSPHSSQSYFGGHPSSNIAYAMHFGLQIIGHEAIPREYEAVLRRERERERARAEEEVGFWHDGSREGVGAATLRAIASWRRRCVCPSSLCLKQ